MGPANFTTPIASPNQLTAQNFSSFGAQALPQYGTQSNSSITPQALQAIFGQTQGSVPGGGLSGALQTAGSVADLAGGLAQIYLGFQANKLAKKNFEFQKTAYNNNLEASTSAYNTALADRANARYHTQNNSAGAAAYINENKLTPKSI